MKDPALLSIVKRILLAARRADLALTRRWRSPAPYVLGGACRRSGLCCEAPALTVGFLTATFAPFRWAFATWQRRINGMELRRVRVDERTLVFHCTHFDDIARSCDSYDTRPWFCRDYPKSLLDQASPVFLQGCGHRPILRNAAAMKLALDAQNLTPEQRRTLDRELHLE